MQDIFKSRQFELACRKFRLCSDGNSGIIPNSIMI